MYKKFTYQELCTIHTSFFEHIKTICAKYKYPSVKSFLDTSFPEEQDRLYFFESNKPVMRRYKLGGGAFRVVDEKEAIEVMLPPDDVTQLHNMLKNTQAMKQMSKESKSLLDQLLEQFLEWARVEILGKPYLVYDIETTFVWNHLRDQHFEMAYYISTLDEHSEKFAYHYVDASSAKKFCDFLLAYDGYIIGYNQIWFDNPVLAMNAGYGDTEIEVLNKKSIDPFLFLRQLTWRRMSLNNVATALISSWKTLSSGKEWEMLLQHYKKTGDAATLTKVKNYCKNDVHITFGVLLYLLSYNALHVDDKSYNYDLAALMHLGGHRSSVVEVSPDLVSSLFTED